MDETLPETSEVTAAAEPGELHEEALDEVVGGTTPGSENVVNVFKSITVMPSM